MKPRIVALVPMRHHSERVPGKNYRKFAGRPLFHCILETLLACGDIDEIVIDTDSPLIMKNVSIHFPRISLLERPAHLRAGEVPMNDVLAWDVSQISADFYLQTHSTNPLLRSDTIANAIAEFIWHHAHAKYDSLFSVTRLQTRLWDRTIKPVNHDPKILLRTQDLPPLYEENSNLYIFSKKSLEEHNSRIGRRPMIYEIDRREAIDIDDELDFEVAEYFYRRQCFGKKEPVDNETENTRYRALSAAAH